MKSTELLSKFKKLTHQHDQFKNLPDQATLARHERAFDAAVKQIKAELRKKKAKKELQDILTWEHQRGRLKDMTDEWHELNELEQAGLSDECECHRKIMAARYEHFEPGNTYKYKKTWNPAKEMHTMEVFGVMIRTSEQRITPQVRQKMKLGLNVTQDEFLPDLELHDRIILNESEWDKYFRHVDSIDLDDTDLMGDHLSANNFVADQAAL